MSAGGVDPSRIFVPGAMLGGRYRIDVVITKYGAQATLLGTRSDGLRVVIEVLGVERLARRARLLDGLFREAGIPALFNRPDLLEIIDFGVEPMTQNPFLVLPYRLGRPAPEIVAPNGPEKRTASAFVEVCHGLLDSHDGEILNAANAMPTAVPGAMPTQAPGLAPAHAIPPSVAPDAPGPAIPAGSEDEGEPQIGGGGLRWVVAAIAIGIGIYSVLPDRALEAPYYNPNITTPTIIHNPGAGRIDPRVLQHHAEGMVNVDSSPSGAEIWMGRSLLGETPMDLPKPTGGDRMNLVLKRPGFLDKAVVVNRETEGVDVELNPLAETKPKDSIVGTREKGGGLLDGNPFEPKDDRDRYGVDPMRKTPFVNPFGEPGTAPPMPGDRDDLDPYEDPE